MLSRAHLAQTKQVNLLVTFTCTNGLVLGESPITGTDVGAKGIRAHSGILAVVSSTCAFINIFKSNTDNYVSLQKALIGLAMPVRGKKELGIKHGQPIRLVRIA